ncbi:ATP-binding protein [Methanospirillum hungatei]|uniref:ATP-binding protein n=1 Tax=Methanospirillum hungatei TaxID=2203 RepID=UPI0026F1A113|nr:ATP-binding protein [Methanospirillum hungatei]MCA1916262.1 ATP-binding protein [Methanospirillum hungatei]
MPSLLLPIGIQSFEKIRSEGYYYVDKTPYIAELAQKGSYYFLSRPRRFGKSLFIDTLSCAFKGKKDLFSGLYLDRPESGWDFEKKYPVIKISFAQRVNRSSAELSEYLTRIISQEAAQYGLSIDHSISSGFQLEDLIRELFKKTGKKVVLLVDEYDKPILDNLHDQKVALELREDLKSFYSIIKDLDPFLTFVMLTGVSKFGKTGIFSGLNNLKDITLDSRYSAICGYTQTDLEQVFTEHLSGFDNDEVKRWYNGYSWTGESVYNPFDILLLFDEGTFKPYWFETGTPTFLIKLWESNPRLPAEYEDFIAGTDLLGSFDPEHIRIETLLFQAGYLTIKKWSADPIRGFTCWLGYPNVEVRTSLNTLFAEVLSKQEISKNREMLYDILEREDPSQIHTIFSSLFASIPYDWYRKNQLSQFEWYYASIVYTYFASLGYEVIPEDTTNKGRIDLTVKTKTGIWIFEFKVSDSPSHEPGSPLNQIREKKYREKYESDGRKIFEIGIIFNPMTRNIDHWEVQ